MGMGTNNNNNNSTPSTTTTTTSLERSYFEAFYSKTTPSTTTQSKWAAAATPTAPARAAPALRAPAPAANKQILSPIDLREHHPPAPECYRITSAFTIVISTRESCEWTFGTCHEASWIAGVDRRADSRRYEIKNGGGQRNIGYRNALSLLPATHESRRFSVLG